MGLGINPGASQEQFRRTLSHVLWLGGGTGAGKTTIARKLSEKYSLQHYDYDYQDSRSHSERTRPDLHPNRSRFLAMSLDERWVLRSPQEMVESALRGRDERFGMVLEDLLAMPTDRVIIAEGFGLDPDLVQPLLTSSRQAIWLLPTSRLRLHTLESRGSLWAMPNKTSDPERALANRLERDRLLTEHVARVAAELRLRTVEIDIDQSLEAVFASVEAHYLPLLPLLDPKSPAEGPTG